MWAQPELSCDLNNSAGEAKGFHLWPCPYSYSKTIEIVMNMRLLQAALVFLPNADEVKWMIQGEMMYTNIHI